ncbi:MAG: diguanylate cyclase [Pelolinea sp.]|nr:diguanylate cyclase [Pelolinea sp.]
MNPENVTLNKVTFYVGKATLIAAAYFIAYLIGGFFALNGSGIPLLWPQAGFALAAILLLGYSSLPGIFVGSLITTLAANNIPVMFAIMNSIVNTLAVFVPAYFIFHEKKFSKLLDNYRSVFFLILFGMIVQPLISALVSVTGLYFLELSPIELLPSVLSNRWLRDALGVLVFTPVLLVWFGNPFPNIKNRRSLEGFVIFLLVIGLALIIFFGEMPSAAAHSISFLVIPLIIWSSIRNRIHGVLLINLCASIIFLWGISYDQGCLFNGDILQYQTYVSVIYTMLITSLVISASMTKLRASQQNLAFLSTHDTLTGLYNRLFFETEFLRLEKSRQFPISIIMADVDELKMVNDDFGHETGDQVLKNVAALFSDVFRQEDIVSRFGGDEFVILLPDSDASTAKKIIKRIKKQINEYNQKHSDLPINVSLGVSTANQGESLKGHLKNADTLMYQEKQKRKRKAS